MKCPLLATAIVRELGEPLGDEADCLQAECAWRDDTLKLCSVKVIGQFVVGISIYLHTIAENIPFKA